MKHVQLLVSLVPHGTNPVVWRAAMAFGRWKLAHEADLEDDPPAYTRDIWQESVIRTSLRRQLDKKVDRGV